MSEEILKALMQLFALITKQDEGIGQKELDYVNDFLIQQIGVDSAPEYLQLFKDTSEQDPIPYKDFSPKKAVPPDNDPAPGTDSAAAKDATTGKDSAAAEDCQTAGPQ